MKEQIFLLNYYRALFCDTHLIFMDSEVKRADKANFSECH